MNGNQILSLLAIILGPGGAITALIALFRHNNGPKHKPARHLATSADPNERPPAH